MKYWRIPLDTDTVDITRGIVHILEDRCKGCGYCIAFCPREVLEFSKTFNAKGYHPPRVKNDDCLNCHYCELLCPEFAIFSSAAPPPSQPVPGPTE
ncbi:MULTISPECIES: 4Fe-4S dicluster domain-containing protein [Desulfococcus]|uniref:4Fe-4S ferredoxin iron-sulfur binding domain-containing protein n=1 Tax=Desulfococcus multivorans DSM 2059 TaxID=1121405 RepID=S7TUM8_DESML|nr:4Fe-4S dicluster domain-containing protein [Desulfococcus multivorans]AOY57059.1 4Fe-4S ferredoxin iron-sulfur protein [Desulfococcus multivorans]AQU99573.1 4Fe-4S ferredoxin [Desulfococcus multivorans]EPR40742.1 4Fe-4S ferredoxin iron-sulfur binding domain-containing protein [Desulfococcus multivorans DSM 2059]SJZ88478.1 2-oxoglutarate ferredoxin oxidoreductase subunit delta [Desulfococcus multivorans DSM 2059]